VTGLNVVAIVMPSNYRVSGLIPHNSLRKESKNEEDFIGFSVINDGNYRWIG